MPDNSVLQEVKNTLSEIYERQLQIISCSSIGGGCINHASKLETNCGNFFLKWNNNCASDIFIREAESLKELKKAAGDFLAIPEVFAAKRADETPGFLVLEFLESGYSLGNSQEKLGRGLAKIHQFSHSKFGFYNDNYCGATLQNNLWKDNWIEFFRDNRIDFLLQLIML